MHINAVEQHPFDCSVTAAFLLKVDTRCEDGFAICNHVMALAIYEKVVQLCNNFVQCLNTRYKREGRRAT